MCVCVCVLSEGRRERSETERASQGLSDGVICCKYSGSGLWSPVPAGPLCNVEGLLKFLGKGGYNVYRKFHILMKGYRESLIFIEIFDIIYM